MLRASDGRAFPTRTRPLDRWADGTVRWLLVDALVRDVDGACELHSAPEFDAAPKPRLAIEESPGIVSVDTGVARFTMQRGRTFPFVRVEYPAGVQPIQHSHLTLIDSSGQRHLAELTTVAVEDGGPVRGVVLLTGSVSAGSGRSLVVKARVHFYAGLPAARVVLTITNSDRARHAGGFWDLGDPGSVLVKDVSIAIAASSTSGIRVSAEPEEGFQPVDGNLELYQDSSGGEQWRSSNHLNRERRVPTTFRGYRLRAGQSERRGLRATPIVEAHGISVAIPDFWQNFPRACEIDGLELAIRMFPGQFADLHELQGGEQKTHEFYISCGRAETLAWTRRRLVASVDPAHVLESGAVPFLAELTPEHERLVNSAIEGPDSFEAKRELIDEFGWRHFGDLYGDHESVRQKNPPVVSHYNNQYDALAGFIYQFLRSGDVRWWRMARELAAHVIDIDVYHTTEDKSAYNHGLFWHTYHYGDADTSTHRTYPAAGRGKTFGGGPSADHNYTTGLMLFWFLTGDPEARTTAVDLAQFVIDMDDGGQTVFRWLDRGNTGRAILSATGYFGPGRGPANSLNALVDGFRLTGDERFDQKADEIVRTVVHPAQDIEALRLDVPELRWFYTMFLQSLGKYIHARVERGKLDTHYAYARECLLHFARYMAAHEHPFLDKPEKLEFPTETWAAQDIRKSDVFMYAAINASAEQAALFADRSRYFHEYSVSALTGDPRRTLLRPVVVLLTSGFMLGWRQTHPGYQEPPGPALNALELPVAFVPQRVRAERRAKQLIGAAAVLVLGAIAVMFTR